MKSELMNYNTIIYLPGNGRERSTFWSQNMCSCHLPIRRRILPNPHIDLYSLHMLKTLRIQDFKLHEDSTPYTQTFQSLTQSKVLTIIRKKFSSTFMNAILL